jgi:hypothetical protein
MPVFLIIPYVFYHVLNLHSFLYICIPSAVSAKTFKISSLLFRNIGCITYFKPSSYSVSCLTVTFNICVKAVPLHAGAWGRGTIAPTLFWHRHLMEWVVGPPKALYPRGNDPRYSLDRRLGKAQSQSGKEARWKSFAPAGDRAPIAR